MTQERTDFSAHYEDENTDYRREDFLADMQAKFKPENTVVVGNERVQNQYRADMPFLDDVRYPPIARATAEDMEGKDILGTAPMQIGVHANSVTEYIVISTLEDRENRGGGFDQKQMEQRAESLVTYRVHQSDLDPTEFDPVDTVVVTRHPELLEKLEGMNFKLDTNTSRYDREALEGLEQVIEHVINEAIGHIVEHAGDLELLDKLVEMDLNPDPDSGQYDRETLEGQLQFIEQAIQQAIQLVADPELLAKLAGMNFDLDPESSQYRREPPAGHLQVLDHVRDTEQIEGKNVIGYLSANHKLEAETMTYFPYDQTTETYGEPDVFTTERLGEPLEVVRDQSE